MTPITELTVLTAPKALWKEFLEAYFDGGAHDVGAHAGVTFPKANLRFGQGRPKQPLAAVDNPTQAAQTSAEIRVLCFPRSEHLTWNVSPTEGEHLLATNHVLFQFQVRARSPREEDAELLADKIGQLLHALLKNPETSFPLARHGLAHLAPKTPEVLSAADYAVRLVNCGAQLLFPILFGDTAPADGTVTTLASGQTLLPFLREMPLVVGEYLGGYYQLVTARRAVAADLVAHAGLTDTVLELERNGTLTGLTVTIPAGAANTEVTATASLGNLAVTAGQTLRWKIISGSAPEDAAWKVSLTLRLG